MSALLAKMSIKEKLQQVQLLSDGQVTDADARNGVGGVFSLVDPARINELQHIAVEQSRLHGSRSCSPTTRSTATARSSRSRSAPPARSIPNVASDGPPVRRARVRRGRPQADLQPDGRRLSRAALGPHLRGRRRGSLPELRVRRRAREGRAGPRLLRHGQGRHERQALRRLRPAGGRARLQHDRHVRAAAAQPLPAAVQGRRRRGLRHRDVLVQRHQRRPGLREQASSRPTCSRASGASTASSRATTRPSPSCAPARPSPTAAVRPRRRRRRPAPQRR